MTASAPYTITLDDDPLVHKLITRALGIPSLPYASSSGLLARVDRYKPLALFVDVHLGPDDCGLDAIPALRRAWPFTPILVMTTNDVDAAIGDALAAGANDFIRKPVSRQELTARLNVRLTEMHTLARRDCLEIGPLRYQKTHRSISCGDRVHHLTPSEALLLETLAHSFGLVVPRAELKRRVWGDLKVSDNALDKKIHDLRSSLKILTDEVTVTAVYKQGLRLTAEKAPRRTEVAA